MALLQISEPGMSPIPHQRRTAIGIDLGTSNSLVAVVRSSIPQVLHFPEHSPLVPSVVHFAADGSLQIGTSALPFLTTDPENTVYSAKRLLGRGLTDVAALGLPYVCKQSDSGVQIQTVQGLIEPITISAHILATLRQKAEDLLSEDLVGAVITVPAYFDDAQRQATLDAAKLARIDVLRLLNEPTAAALAYGLDKGVEGVYAVYDLGGGTFDVSILRLQAGVFEVVATAGNTALGGDDFDRLLLDWLYTQIAFDQSVSSVKAAWLSIAKQLREAFSSVEPAASPDVPSSSLVVRFQKTVQQQRVQAVTIEVHSEQHAHHSIMLTREMLEEMCAPLVDQTLAVVQRALADAQLDVPAIQGVVMVGGATRMPLIQDAVQAFFHRPPLIDLNPDEVVALGAALQANILAGNRTDQDWLLLDVLPLSLGLEVMGGLVERIIPRNSAIPVARAQEFTTFKDGQTAMALHVVQGEREIVSECRSLARFELQGIPPMVAGAARIRVTFQVDADGLLSVNAREESSGVSTQVVVQPSYGLTDDQMRMMLEDGMQKAEADKEERIMRELRVDAERLLVSVHSALAEDADLLASEERSAIDAALANLQAQLSSQERSPLQSAIDTLAVLTTPFAEARMNRSIRRVLEGKKIQELS